MWTAIFYALTAGLCAVCLIGCIASVRTATAERASLHKRLRSCESATQLTIDSQEELREIVKSIAESQKMQRVRKATTHATGSQGEPDPRTDPEGWRNWKNAQLRAGKYN